MQGKLIEAKNKTKLTANSLLGTGDTLMGWFRSLPFLNKIFLVLFSVLFVSPIGANKLLVVSGTFVGDPLLIGWALQFFMFSRSGKKIFRELFLGGRKLVFAFLFLMFLEGLLLTDGNVIYAYTDFRCASLIFGFFVLCQSQDEQIRKSAIYSATIMVLINIVLTAVFFHYFVSADMVKNNYPAFGLFLLAIVSYFERLPLLAMVGLVLSLFVATTSFYRSLMVIPFLFVTVIGVRLMRSLARGKTETKNGKILLFLFVVLGVCVSPWVVQKILHYFQSSAGNMDQSIVKINNLVGFFQGKGLGKGDIQRANYLSFILDNWPSFLLPSGLGHKAIIGNWGPIWSDDKMVSAGANSMDGMHLYFALHFGLIVTVLVACYLGERIYRSLTQSSLGLAAIKFILLLLCAINMFSTASAFALISNAIFMGATFGCLCFTPRRQVPKPMLISPINKKDFAC